MVLQPMWIVQAPFSALRFVNNGKHLQGDEVPECGKLQRELKNNAEFYQHESPSSVTSFSSDRLLAVRGLRNLK